MRHTRVTITKNYKMSIKNITIDQLFKRITNEYQEVEDIALGYKGDLVSHTPKPQLPESRIEIMLKTAKTSVDKLANDIRSIAEWVDNAFVKPKLSVAPMFGGDAAFAVVNQFRITPEGTNTPIAGTLLNQDETHYRLVLQIGKMKAFVADAEVKVSSGAWQAVQRTNKQGQATFEDVPHNVLFASLNIEINC